MDRVLHTNPCDPHVQVWQCKPLNGNTELLSWLVRGLARMQGFKQVPSHTSACRVLNKSFAIYTRVNPGLQAIGFLDQRVARGTDIPAWMHVGDASINNKRRARNPSNTQCKMRALTTSTAPGVSQPVV